MDIFTCFKYHKLLKLLYPSTTSSSGKPQVILLSFVGMKITHDKQIWDLCCNIFISPYLYFLSDETVDLIQIPLKAPSQTLKWWWERFLAIDNNLVLYGFFAASSESWQQFSFQYFNMCLLFNYHRRKRVPQNKSGCIQLSHREEITLNLKGQ